MSEHQLTIILGRIKKILINVSNNFVTSFYSSNFNALNVLQKVSKEIVTTRHQPPLPHYDVTILAASKSMI